MSIGYNDIDEDFVELGLENYEATRDDDRFDAWEGDEDEWVRTFYEDDDE